MEKFNFAGLNAIANIFQNAHTNVSLTDCSAWYYAKQTSGRLLTGDGNLRKEATKEGVKVLGILFILDNLVESKIISENDVASKQSQLILINPRLPHAECQTRIDAWSLLK